MSATIEKKTKTAAAPTTEPSSGRPISRRSSGAVQQPFVAVALGRAAVPRAPGVRRVGVAHRVPRFVYSSSCGGVLLGDDLRAGEHRLAAAEDVGVVACRATAGRPPRSPGGRAAGRRRSRGCRPCRPVATLALRSKVSISALLPACSLALTAVAANGRAERDDGVDGAVRLELGLDGGLHVGHVGALDVQVLQLARRRSSSRRRSAARGRRCPARAGRTGPSCGRACSAPRRPPRRPSSRPGRCG